MNDIENATLRHIGKNIRRIRKVKGFTLQQLADAIAESTGIDITGAAIGAWERGTREPSAVMIHFMAEAMQCSEQAFYADISNSIQIDRAFARATGLGEEDKRTLLFVATRWEGNVHALIQFVQMYMNMDKKYRADVAGMGIMMYRKARAEGHLIPDATYVDADYIESEWERLMKR